MRSSRKYNKLLPCGNTCRCHQPVKAWGNTPSHVLIASVLVLGLIFAFSVFVGVKLQSSTQHILVNGRDCIIQNVTDSCTSTGYCNYHNIAVCPSENK
jgi:hypothetical protein